MSQQSESKTSADAVEVEKTHIYHGQGTEEDPFILEFRKDDPSNPMNWSQLRKWFITAIATVSVFAVTLTSSAYAASGDEIIQEFNISSEVFIVGVSIFVLGFAIGPAVWGPLVCSSLVSPILKIHKLKIPPFFTVSFLSLPYAGKFPLLITYRCPEDLNFMEDKFSGSSPTLPWWPSSEALPGARISPRSSCYDSSAAPLAARH
jgi:hypothetical protein